LRFLLTARELWAFEATIIRYLRDRLEKQFNYQKALDILIKVWGVPRTAKDEFEHLKSLAPSKQDDDEVNSQIIDKMLQKAMQSA